MGTNTYLAATSSSGGGSSLYLPLFLIVIFGAFYFLMIRPQRNRQRQIMQQQNQVQPGQRVRTTAGMYATVTAVEQDSNDVILEIAPGVNVRYLRRAIMEVIPGEVPLDDPAPDDDPVGDDLTVTDVTSADAPEGTNGAGSSVPGSPAGGGNGTADEATLQDR